MEEQQIIEDRCPLWHAMPLPEVFRDLDSSESGLSSTAAAKRLAEVGPNRLPEARPRSAWMRFLTQFHNVLIYVLQAGDKIAADLRLVQAKNLRNDEAALTGESAPVEKTQQACSESAVLADQRSMAYSDTLITAGQGLGMVTATGSATELWQISTLVARVEQLTTPLLRQMAVFSRWLTVAIAGAAFTRQGSLVRTQPRPPIESIP